MEIVRKIVRMRAVVEDLRRQGRKIGLVPTMGGLHVGHLALVRLAKDHGAEVVVSIFVNPKQFGPGEDLSRYPRDLTRDGELLVEEGVAWVFAPDVDEIYPPGHCTHVDVEGLGETLSGESRPGHFRGVATVVLKLINIVKPDFAVFGWKDAQQLLVLRRMVSDLNLDVELVAVPTVRDSDGVASSTRNQYLDEEGRKSARLIHRALQEGAKAVEDGERSPEKLQEKVRGILGQDERITIDHVQVVRDDNLKPLKRLSGPVLVLVSVKVRPNEGPPVLLIDNVRIKVPEES